MEQQFDLEKALRILKKKKITKGQVADSLGYDGSYLSKLISGEKPLTEQFLNSFLKEYGDKLNEVEAVIEDPMKELMLAIMRIESKVDTLSLIFEVLTEDQKTKVSQILNGDFEEKETFKLFNEAAKKRAQVRLKRRKQQGEV